MKPHRPFHHLADAHSWVLLALALLAAPLANAASKPAMDGAKVYHEFCSVCHGDKGNANSRAKASFNPAPRDFTSPKASAELDRERMIKSVSQGRPGTAMTPWNHQLSAAEIGAVVDYIRETFMLPATEDSGNRGRALYAQFCSVCHGDRGDGNSRATGSLIPPPRNFTDPRAVQELNRDRMIFGVTYGRPNTAMGAWGSQLSAEDIAAVVDYVRASFMQTAPQQKMAQPGADHGAGHQPSQGMPGMSPAKDKPAGGHAHQHATPTGDTKAFLAAAFLDGLKGDAGLGKLFYNENCATCHGEEGDGNGPRAFFILPRPRDFRHPAARNSLNRPHLYTAIAKGTLGSEMPAWDTVLNPQELANVSEYVFRKFIQTADAKPPATMKTMAADPKSKGHPHVPGKEH